VVAALSDRWGVSTAPDGKVVWAELQANGDPHAPTDPSPADPPAPPSAPPADAPGTRPVQALRRWFVDQMAAQLLHGATPTPPG
jgi:hypothetical protein